MRQGGEPQGVQVVRQGEPTPYHCNFNPLYPCNRADTTSTHTKAACTRTNEVQAAFCRAYA